MKNITLSIDDDLLKEGRAYAKRCGTSLNSLVRTLIRQTVVHQNSNWIQECFTVMDEADGHSQGKKWSREELYDV